MGWFASVFTVEPERLRRTRRILAALGGVAVAAAAACTLSASAVRVPAGLDASDASTARAGFGTLAGYVWEGQMHSIGASWAVPTIAKGSRQGYAGTWIGAQETFGNSAPFIQVGTNENKGPRGTTDYYAFWTDAVRHFHPVALFPVAPGARITASLRLSEGRWTVFIRDANSGKEARFSTGEDADASFSLAEWLQEDPQIGSSPGPYPSIERVMFEKLSLNGIVPQYARLHSQWMTVDDENIGPSRFIHDSFLLKPVTISAAGAQYLRIADQ